MGQRHSARPPQQHATDEIPYARVEIAMKFNEWVLVEYEVGT